MSDAESEIIQMLAKYTYMRDIDEVSDADEIVFLPSRIWDRLAACVGDRR